jgi:hypothetical protein
MLSGRRCSMPGCMFPVSRSGTGCVRDCALTFRRYRRLHLQKEGTLDLSLQGIWIADREWPSAPSAYHVLPSFPPAVLGWDVAQAQIPAVDFVHKYEHVFAFKCVLTPEI